MVLVASAVIIVSMVYPNLPSLEAMTNYQPKIPMRVYSSDGFKIGEFGIERREVVKFQDIPAALKQAVLAAEDSRFYEHHGVDFTSVIRAMMVNLIGGAMRQGGSTITQQITRNFYLTRDKTYSRKIYEALLAFKVEKNLTKDQILELYMNHIYLGQRAYGFGAASSIYFGVPLQSVSLAQAAMLAGLPKSPSTANPVRNPERARLRQVYVLKRMHQLGYISEEALQEALKEKIKVFRKHFANNLHAEYVAEAVRQFVMQHFDEKSYVHGLRIYTTISSRDQNAAYRALRRGVMFYDRRYGYRGPEAIVKLDESIQEADESLDKYLDNYEDYDDLLPVLVLESSADKVKAYRRGGGLIEIKGDGLKFAARMLGDQAPKKSRVRRGAIIRVQKKVYTLPLKKLKKTKRKISAKDKKGHPSAPRREIRWHIVQLPEVEAGFVSMDPQTGRIRAMVGGFDFARSKFDHARQSWRQSGSVFKPFVYSAALEKGFNASTIVDDSPISLRNAQTGGKRWNPKNYDGRYSGPITVRDALKRSKNMVSVRIMQEIGVAYTQDYITRFGFSLDKQPAYLTMALGTGMSNPWEMTRAFSVFANGGFLVKPHLIERITNHVGEELYKSEPVQAGNESIRTIDARNAYVMNHMLRDVTRYGTAARVARSLRRSDLGGKTGTTNESIDGWFCGYHNTVSACVWMGFDQPKSLGRRESGGGVALPIWINYMKTVLKDVPKTFMKQPEGLLWQNNNVYYDRGDGTPENPDPELLSLDEIIESTAENVTASPQTTIPARLAPAVVWPPTKSLHRGLEYDSGP